MRLVQAPTEGCPIYYKETEIRQTSGSAPVSNVISSGIVTIDELEALTLTGPEVEAQTSPALDELRLMQRLEAQQAIHLVREVKQTA